MAMINGYPIIYKPNNIHANKDGYAFEHILIAEQKLGFEFTHGEIVHHKDLNRANNNPENLIVFASKSEHTSFHMNGCDESLLQQLENGTYIVIKHKTISTPTGSKNICPMCNKNLKDRQAKMCLECYQKQEKHYIFQKITQTILPREELKKLIRTSSFLQIGKMYGVSDNAIRKWCDKYDLPRRRQDIKAYSDEEWAKI